ncbi:MAG: LPS assembly lipoprotein LptE [Alphaproteobacteria bacterium]
MSYFRVTIFALCLAAAGLGACGFQPLYGQRTGSASAQELALVTIDTIADREGQKLHNFLRDRLNPLGSPPEPFYRLQLKLTTSTRQLAIRKDATASRANLILSANFILTDIRTRKVLFRGRSRSTNSYNILVSEFATIASLNDATTRAARELSDEISARLAIFFSRRHRGY